MMVRTVSGYKAWLLPAVDGGVKLVYLSGEPPVPLDQERDRRAFEDLTFEEVAVLDRDRAATKRLIGPLQVRFEVVRKSHAVLSLVVSISP
jgi:hypothetical protein